MHGTPVDGPSMRILRLAAVLVAAAVAIGLAALGLYVAYLARLWYRAATDW